MTQPNREPKSAEREREVLERLCAWQNACENHCGVPLTMTVKGQEEVAEDLRFLLAGYEAALASPETEHVEPEGEVDALVAEALKREAEARANLLHAAEDADGWHSTMPREIAASWEADAEFFGRLATALSSRRASVGRVEVARIIDPDAFDLLDDLRDNPPRSRGEGEFAERADDDPRLFGSEFARADDALSKADAILSRVEGK